MSAFRVGMRVRIVGTVNEYMAHHVGKEGLIVGESFGYPGQWYIDTALEANGRRCCWASHRLEPILPEGAAPSTWAECLWQPEHMRAQA